MNKLKNLKNQKTIAINVLIIFTAIVLMILISINDFSVGRLLGSATSIQSSSYYDWSQLTTLDPDYSYSTLTYKGDTTFYVNAVDSATVRYRTDVYGEDRPVPNILFKNPSVGDDASIIIQNCGIDKDGDRISAVVHVKVAEVHTDDFIHVGADYPNNVPTVTFGITPNTSYTGGSTNQETLNVYPSSRTDAQDAQLAAMKTISERNLGEPISFNLNTQRARAEVDLKYYKTSKLSLTNKQNGKYTTALDSNQVSGASLDYATVSSSSTIDTSITKVNSFYSDIDIKRNVARTLSSDYQYFDGHEGVAPLKYGKSLIYYRKNSNTVTGGFYDMLNSTNLSGFNTFKLGESNNGIYVQTNSAQENSWNISAGRHYASAQFLTSGLEGEYDFTYGGYSCGIGFSFTSPQGYEIPDPVKTVSKTTILPGEQFTYTISQYIPNNFYTVDFSQVYSNFSSSYKLSSLNLKDEITSGNVQNRNNITLDDIYGDDLLGSSKFLLVNSSSNENVTLSASSSYLSSSYPYNNILKMTIPVVYNNKISTSQTLTNSSDTLYNSGGTKTSNTTRITVNPLTLTYDCRTNGGSSSNTTEPQLVNEIVDITRVSCEKENAEFLGWYTQASGGTKLGSTYQMGNTNTTIYGRYEDYPKLTYNCSENGGRIAFPAAQINEYHQKGTTVTLSTDKACTKTNAEFIGWNTNKSATTSQSSLTMPDTDTIIYGIYKDYPKLYFNCNGGTATNFTESSYTQYEAFTPVNIYDGTHTCTKENANFLGWAKTRTATEVLPSYIMEETNRTLYAIYEEEQLPASYLLTYDCETNGGSADFDPNIQFVDQGASVNVNKSTKKCTKENADFLGWSETQNGVTPLPSYTMPASSVTLYGIYSDYPYLAYDCDGGTASFDTSRRQVKPGTSVDVNTATKSCTKENKTFIGWANPVAPRAPLPSYTMPENDITLIAVYTDNPVLKYNCNGGTKGENFGDDQEQYVTGTVVNLDSQTKVCTKENTDFLGWNTDQNANNTINSVTIPSEGTTVYAIYKEYPTLTYNCEANGGRVLINNQLRLKPGTNIDLTKVCTKDNYEFIGWNKNQNATTSSNSIQMTENNLIIYGIYRYRPKLTYNCNGGTQSENFGDNPIIMSSGASADLTRTCTKDGYTQKGWSNSPAGSKLNSLVMGDADVEIYAIYDKNPYTVTYDCNGGTASFNDIVVTKYVGDSVSLDNRCSKEGYRHIGWVKELTDTVPLSSYTMPAANVELHAIYEEIPEPTPYNLTYNCEENGGIANFNPTTISIKEGSLVDLTKKCTKNGYKFIGWNTDKKAITKLNTFTMLSSNTTLFGIYEKIPTLTYNCEKNGGSALFDDVVITPALNSDVDLTKQCAKDGYKFTGWTDKENSNEILKSYKMKSSDTVLYGLYEKITCDLDISSTKYKIDHKNRIINVENNVSDEDIIKGVSSKGDLSINGKQLIVKCDNESKSYDIQRFFIAQTGNNVVKFKPVVLILLVTIIALIIVNRKLLNISFDTSIFKSKKK